MRRILEDIYEKDILQHVYDKDTQALYHLEDCIMEDLSSTWEEFSRI
jgi:hypothetical protein